MSDFGGDPENDRHWRVETLKRLAQRDPEAEEALIKTSPDVGLPIPSIGAWLQSRLRWLIPLATTVLIVALAAGVVARFAPGLRGSGAANTPRPLTPVVFTLPASAAVYCPSMPAWSPDGEYIAVMARSFQPGGQGDCSYGDLVSNKARQELATNGSPSSSSIARPMTVLVLDAKTGVLVRQLKPVDLAGMVCKDTRYCDAHFIMPASLSWTPDGVSVLLFSTINVELTGPDGQGYAQTRGALEIMRVDGTQITRALVAYGRETSTATDAGGGILPVNMYSAPLFTWDLTMGSASYTDIHEAAGVETVDYFSNFQVGPTGKLTPAPTPSAGSITPWSYGVLWIAGNATGPLPDVLFQSSVWAWSADGRYVAPDVDTTAFLNVKNVPSNGQPSYPGAYILPFVTPPDAATAATLREITPQRAVIYVARDPSGARLASFACQPNGSIGALTIRATATGKTLVTSPYTFPTVSTSYGCPGDAEAIDWSPDGSRVAMSDSLDNQIVIWQIPEHA